MHRAIFVLWNAEFYMVLFGFITPQFESGPWVKSPCWGLTALLPVSVLAGIPDMLHCLAKGSLWLSLYQEVQASTRYTHNAIKRQTTTTTKQKEKKNKTGSSEKLPGSFCVSVWCVSRLHAAPVCGLKATPKAGEPPEPAAPGCARMRQALHLSTKTAPSPSPARAAQKRIGKVGNYNWPLFQ